MSENIILKWRAKKHFSDHKPEQIYDLKQMEVISEKPVHRDNSHYQWHHLKYKRQWLTGVMNKFACI